MKKPGGDGRIPFTFRIGVTSHRDLADPDSFCAPVGEALRRLKGLVPVSPGWDWFRWWFRRWSRELTGGSPRGALADKDARLEVALTLPEEEYVKDFKGEASKEEFRCFLIRASETPWQSHDPNDLQF